MNFNIRLNIGDTVSTINIEANTFFEAINKAQLPDLFFTLYTGFIWEVAGVFFG